MITVKIRGIGPFEDFEWTPSTFNVLIGRSGSGKTLLLQVLHALSASFTNWHFLRCLPKNRNLEKKFDSSITLVSSSETIIFNPFTGNGEIIHPNTKVGQWVQSIALIGTKPEETSSSFVMDYMEAAEVDECSGGGFRLRQLLTQLDVFRGRIVLFDLPENGLDPQSIGVFYRAARMAEKSFGSTIVIATHSPVLLNCLNGALEAVYFLQSGRIRGLLEDHNKLWLQNNLLGDLYEHGALGPEKE